MRIRSALVVIALILLTGCAASVKRGPSDVAVSQIPQVSAARLVLNLSGPPTTTDASDWAGFKQEWQVNFQEQATAAGVAFQMQEGPAKATGDSGTLLSVFVTDYRFIRPGTRYAVGMLTGNAYIESKLAFSDLKTGTVFGTQTANTSSSAWEGAFSAMTNKQVAAIAADIFKQMKSGKLVQ